MDYVQALFSFFIAPLFGTVLLGMLWKRATPAGGFWGLLAGTVSSIAMWLWVKLDPGALAYVALSPHAKAMAENMYRGALVVDHLRGRDGGRQPRHRAQARHRAGGPGLRLHADPLRAARAALASGRSSGPWWWRWRW